MLQKKGPIRTLFCQWAAVCLCAEQATGPFSVCVNNSHSVHTLMHMLPLSPLSVLCFLPFLYLLIMLFLLFLTVICLSVPLLLHCCSLSLPCSLTQGIMQTYQKRIVSHGCLCHHSTLYSFQKLPFLLCDLQS